MAATARTRAGYDTYLRAVVSAIRTKEPTKKYDNMRGMEERNNGRSEHGVRSEKPLIADLPPHHFQHGHIYSINGNSFNYQALPKKVSLGLPGNSRGQCFRMHAGFCRMA